MGCWWHLVELEPPLLGVLRMLLAARKLPLFVSSKGKKK